MTTRFPGSLLIMSPLLIPFVEKARSALDRTHASDTINGVRIDRWEFNEPGVLVADELIYYLAQNTYTSTFPWISTKFDTTTIGKHHVVGNHDKDLSLGRSNVIPIVLAKRNNALMKRSERIIIVVSRRLKDEPSIIEEIQRL